jgi:uncharacterized protein (DUF58 family)
MKHVIRIRSNLITYAFPAVLILLVFLQFVSPYRGWMILLVGFGSIWLIAFVWTRSLVRGLNFAREIRFAWAQVGDILEERITLRNDGALPALWLEIEDLSDMPGYHVSMGTGIGGQSENQWTSHRVCAQRGVFRLGPTILHSGDPFGIFQIDIQFPATRTFTVLPQVIPHLPFQIARGGQFGDGRWRSNSFERTVIAKGVREYMPGDSLRHIHWPTVARRDALYVRHFEEAPAGDWWIFVDLEESEQIEQDGHSTLEHAITLSASLADKGFRSGMGIGLVLHDQELLRIPPLQGQAQRWKVMHSLARAKPGKVSLSELLSNALPKTTSSASIIVITPSLKIDWLDRLSHIVALGAAPTVFLLDPVSFGRQGDTTHVLAFLSDLGVHQYLVTRELLPRLEPKAHGSSNSLPMKRGRRADYTIEESWKELT